MSRGFVWTSGLVALVVLCGLATPAAADERVVQLDAHMVVPGEKIPLRLGDAADPVPVPNSQSEAAADQAAADEAKQAEGVVSTAEEQAKDVTTTPNPLEDPNFNAKGPKSKSDMEAQKLYKEAEAETDSIDAPKEKAVLPLNMSAADMTDIREITEPHSAAQKEAMVNDALKTWDSAWADTTDSGANHTAPEQQIQDQKAAAVKAKIAFRKMLVKQRQRMAEADKKSRELVDTMHNERIQKVEARTSAAKSAFLASQAADVAAEASVENEQRTDLKRSLKQAQAEEEVIAAAKIKELESVKVAAVDVEMERQSLIVNGEKIPEPIEPIDKTKEEEEAKPEPEAKKTAPVALQPPQSVIDAMKEVGVKNGITVNVEEIAGTKNPDVQKKLLATDEQGMFKFKENQAKMKEKMTEISVKTATKKASVFKETAELLAPALAD